MSIDFGKNLRVETTPIPGLLMVDLPVHGDSRGWFKENWQREKMAALGLPDLGPVQNNISFNDAVGTTRGIHAEPWDKWVSVATGRIFGAWVDLREGPTFGKVYTAELDASRGIFIPRGVGNSYQTLEADTSYVYLVNDHWSPGASYTFLNLADPTVGIPWPIPLSEVQISEKDTTHPVLSEVTPMAPRKILVTGAGGQVGRAIRSTLGDGPHIEYATRTDLDLTGDGLDSARHWRDYGTIINAAAFTAVDDAESSVGRVSAWESNVTAVAGLARIATQNQITLVHLSSDYVFDGTKSGAYAESDPMSPLGVYGQTKAAADLIVSTVPRHYVIRTSWVIGDGGNFVRTMARLAESGVDPAVVDDQLGRLTSAHDLANSIRHLLETSAPAGTYNVTGAGPVMSWYDVARTVFARGGHDPNRVSPVSTHDYMANSTRLTAPRPANSELSIEKITSAGFTPRDGVDTLEEFLDVTR